ncbi:MAG TPA: vWA domain-containing protein [Methylibium sp.]|nr:vWA domain-containing protein [Methylibium sp.]
MNPLASFDHPWLLLALPLALLPWWQRPREALVWSWGELLPPDRASDLLDVGLRAIASLAVAALVVGAAGWYRPAYEVEQVGQGAEIVMLVDRSRSMDQPFVTGAARHQQPSLLSYQTGREAADKSRQTKQQVAREMLAGFAAQRGADRFAMETFTTLPIRVMGFSQKPAAVQASIAAGKIGRGLAETDIGLAMLDALDLFRDRPYTGSRIVMLVSDGGDVIEPERRDNIAKLAREYRVGIYWIYIRSHRSPGLRAEEAAMANGETAPEYFLHRFLGGIGVPYRAYEAEDPEALKRALADVGRLENLPISYRDIVPRRDLARWAWGAALALVLTLLVAKLTEIRTWR